MIKNFPRILFFIAGATPTDEEYNEAQHYLPNMAFRNAAFVPADASVGSLEQCDGVAGLVPEIYAKNRPSAKQAGEAFAEAQFNARQDRLTRQDKQRQEQERKAEEAVQAANVAKTKGELKASAANSPTAAKAATSWTPNQ